MDPAPYLQWAGNCSVPPTIIAEQNADLTYRELTFDNFKQRLLTACEYAAAFCSNEMLAEMRRIIEVAQPFQLRDRELEILGHAVTRPGVAALAACGVKVEIERPFDRVHEKTAPYVDQILKISLELLRVRQTLDVKDFRGSFPLAPVFNLFAPALLTTTSDLQLPPDVEKTQKRQFKAALQLLREHRGYNFQIRTERQKGVVLAEGRIAPHPLLQIRAMELELATECISSLSASDLSVTLRLPNDVNRTSGAARQFATHYRSNENRSRKRLLAFREVQNRLKEAVPDQLLQLIKENPGDIRIVSDAHLEWLNIDGLPLSISRTTSRIPVTPGNLFVELITGAPFLRLMPDAFKKVLVISALKRDDPIQGLIQKAFAAFEKDWADSLEVKFVEVGNEAQLIAALNGFDGAMAIFDGHGSHAPDEPAVLHLQNEQCDVWSLQRKVRVPPIIFLSACDTHAADRNHATTANGFLALGARAVLGSVFPLSAVQAAIFCARFVWRVAKFIPAAVAIRDGVLTWSEVVSGMLRMQLLTDFLRLLKDNRSIDEPTYFAVHQIGNVAINDGQLRPFSLVIEELVQRGCDEAQLRRDLEMAVATSSVISYLNMGRPETIILDTERRMIAELRKPLP